jgi:hypothetical protein
VIFCDGASDAFAMLQSGREDVPDNFQQLRQKVEEDKQQASFSYLEDTNTYRLIELMMDDLLVKQQGQPDASVPRRKELDRYAHLAAENYLENIRFLQPLSERFGFRYIIFQAPDIFVGNKRLGPEERRTLERFERERPGTSQLIRKTRDLMFSATDRHFVSLVDAFDHTSDEVYIDSAGHMNPIGNRLIAEHMLEAILRSGVEPEPRHSGDWWSSQQ